MIRRAGARSSSASAAARNRAAEPTADIAAVFRSCDADGNGTISREELEQVLRALDPGIWDDRKITTLFEEIDASGNKEIEYDEFVNWAMAGSQVARGLMRSGAQGNQARRAPAHTAQPHEQERPHPACGGAEKQERIAGKAVAIPEGSVPEGSVPEDGIPERSW